MPVLTPKTQTQKKEPPVVNLTEPQSLDNSGNKQAKQTGLAVDNPFVPNNAKAKKNPYADLSEQPADTKSKRTPAQKESEHVANGHAEESVRSREKTQSTKSPTAKPVEPKAPVKPVESKAPIKPTETKAPEEKKQPKAVAPAPVQEKPVNLLGDVSEDESSSESEDEKSPRQATPENSESESEEESNQSSDDEEGEEQKSPEQEKKVEADEPQQPSTEAAHEEDEDETGANEESAETATGGNKRKSKPQGLPWADPIDEGDSFEVYSKDDENLKFTITRYMTEQGPLYSGQDVIAHLGERSDYHRGLLKKIDDPNQKFSTKIEKNRKTGVRPLALIEALLHYKGNGPVSTIIDAIISKEQSLGNKEFDNINDKLDQMTEKIQKRTKTRTPQKKQPPQKKQKTAQEEPATVQKRRPNGISHQMLTTMPPTPFQYMSDEQINNYASDLRAYATVLEGLVQRD